mmetsp:Transcript_82089/g.206544  ORF Transcript_82089/g.206544 Transcript_82089/m.206544 type:complete len:214 (-) Transcript_82089:16-657(-)
MRSSKSSSRSSEKQAARTSPSEASFSRCKWSIGPSGDNFNFSISRNFFCKARTLLRTASLSPKSMTLGFGPFRFGSAGCCGTGASLPGQLWFVPRNLCSMRSASGVARERSMWFSRQKRRAMSRQFSPKRDSSKWVPHADWISQMSLSGSSVVSGSASVPWRAFTRLRTVSLSRNSTSKMTFPDSEPSRACGGGGSNRGAGCSLGSVGRQKAP